WWFTHMMPMVRKLIAYAAYCGQPPTRSWVRMDPVCASAPIGSRLNTSTVMATANTPSLNPSSRLVSMPGPGRRSVRGRLRPGRARGGGCLRPAHGPGQDLGHVDDL